MNNSNDPYEYDDDESVLGCLKVLLTLVIVIFISTGLVALLLRLFTGK